MWPIAWHQFPDSPMHNMPPPSEPCLRLKSACMLSFLILLGFADGKDNERGSGVSIGIDPLAACEV